MSEFDEMIKKHGQHNFMIGIGYARDLWDRQQDRIQQLESELAKERAVVDHYADKDLWEPGEVEHYNDVVAVHDCNFLCSFLCNFLDVGKVYTNTTNTIRYSTKRARARQQARLK